MSRTQTQTHGRLVAFDFVRVVAVLGVVIYHSAAAYSTNTPYWSVHDGSSAFATGIRELVDVFIMPLFFFLAGYFALSSLKKRGYWSFFRSKFWELGYIWLLAVIVILPLAWWGISSKSIGSSQSLTSYWLNWLAGAGQTSLSVASNPGQLVHMHFWFVSLLFCIFVGFILFHLAATRIFRLSSGKLKIDHGSNKRAVLVLMTFGLVTSMGYFFSLLLVPDTSWLNVKLFLQFQPSKIFLYVSYFGLGLYAHSRNWFTAVNPLGRLAIWAPAAFVLASVFVLLGQDMFLNPAETPGLSPAYLLLFASVRSFFLMSLVVAILLFASRYFNRPSRFIQTVADNSYYIYLIHIFIVFFLQDVLMVWPQGPVELKILSVCLVSFSMSYALSRWVFKKLTMRDWVTRRVLGLTSG
jgi:glucans biosynthesis protein C